MENRAPHPHDDEWCGRRQMGGAETERGKSSVGSMSISAASDSPAGPQGPYAPKRPRDPEQSRPQAERFSSRASSVEADDSSESDPPIPWRRGRPGEEPSLIGRPPLPPPEPRRSFIAQFALLAGVGILSALAVVAFYRFFNHAAAPAVAVTFDEGSGSAAPPTATAVVPAPAAAVPVIPAPAPRAAAVRGVTDSEIRFGIAAPFSGPAKELGRQMK